MINNKLTSAHVPDTRLVEIIEDVDEVLSALAGTNEDVHPDNSTKMCRLWDDLNDVYAPPEVVRQMARELQECRNAQKPVMFIDGDISPADVDKMAAILRECRSANPVLMPGDSGLILVQSKALRDVAAERQRQQSGEGYSPQQDDTYIGGELAAAAISYIEPMEAESYWPADWHDDSFKPSDYRRNLVKAGALILAEIERVDRCSKDKSNGRVHLN